MRLSQFLVELFEHGRVLLEDPFADDQESASDEQDRRLADDVLSERAALVASDFPMVPPPVDLPAALWAATQIYRACYYVLGRDAAAEVMAERLSAAPPSGEPTAQHYSVDLAWRFLPDLDRLTAMLAPEDPLRLALRAWGADWPLSSVGMKHVQPRRVDELLAHPGLRQAYVDRVVAMRDSSRLEDETVRDLVRAALGAERWLSEAWIRTVPAAARRTPPPSEKMSTAANNF